MPPSPLQAFFSDSSIHLSLNLLVPLFPHFFNGEIITATSLGSVINKITTSSLRGVLYLAKCLMNICDFFFTIY